MPVGGAMYSAGTHLPLVLLLVLLTESELEDRLLDPDTLRERGGRVAWLDSL